jgi:hypothetical protein
MLDEEPQRPNFGGRKMGDLKEFLVAIARHWLLLMSSIGSLLVTILERIRKHPVTNKLFKIIAAFCLFSAVFLAWRDQFKAREKAELGMDSQRKRAEYNQRRIDNLTDLLQAATVTDKPPSTAQGTQAVNVSSGALVGAVAPENKGTVVSSINQQGGITAGELQVSVGEPARRLPQAQKMALVNALRNPPKGTVCIMVESTAPDGKTLANDFGQVFALAGIPFQIGDVMSLPPAVGIEIGGVLNKHPLAIFISEAFRTNGIVTRGIFTPPIDTIEVELIIGRKTAR